MQQGILGRLAEAQKQWQEGGGVLNGVKRVFFTNNTGKYQLSDQFFKIGTSLI